MKVLGIKPSAYQFKKRSLKKVDILFYTDHPQVEMWPSPPKFLFYQNGFKWSKMHLWSIFFSEKMGFFQTNPPTKSGKFQIFFFLNPSLRYFYFLSHIQTSIAFFIDVCILHLFCFDNLNLHFYDSFLKWSMMITTTLTHVVSWSDTCFSGTNTRPWFGFDSSLFLSVRNMSTFYVNKSGLYPEFWTGFLEIRNWPF